MCQCGQKRQAISTRAETARSAHAVHTTRAVIPPTIRYQYIGETGLTVFGGVTRGRYRFSHPGAQVAVDARDRSSLDAVPSLKRVSGPAAS